MSLAQAATTGDRLATLRELRDDVAARMESCTSDQNFAILGRLLADTLAQIDELSGASKPKPERTGLDELRARRAGRRAAAGGGERPAGS